MEWSKEDLLDSLKKLYQELGKNPTSTECNACTYTANVSTYMKVFGSWNKAKAEAGIHIDNKYGIKTDKELLESLKAFYQQFNRAPTYKDCRNSNGLFGPNTYKDRFGGWEAALEAADIPINTLRSTQVTEEELLDSLKKFFKEEGKAPRHQDCSNTKKFPYLKAHMVYQRRFGSFSKALSLAKIPLNEGHPDNYVNKTKDDLLNSIKRFYKENGRSPRQVDCQSTPYLSSFQTYVNNFGTFRKALAKAEVPINNKYKQSVAELDLINFIKTEISSTVQDSVSFILKNTELDIYIKDLKLAIEYNGLYWHSETFKNKYYHLSKTQECYRNRIRLIHIFEHEWELKKDIVKSRLRAALNTLPKRVYARKCDIVYLDFKETSEFLVSNHIQGSCPSSYRIGLRENGRIVAIMTFSKARFNKSIEWELTRYCNLLNTTVVGGASKLLKRFIKDKNPKSIISYSDIRWNTGALYLNLGFEYSHNSEPNYWYYKGLKVFSRQKYQKHKLINLLDIYDPKLTEIENMKSNKFNRFFDCGNEVYIWKDNFLKNIS